jgi:hypothetical protein
VIRAVRTGGNRTNRAIFAQSPNVADRETDFDLGEREYQRGRGLAARLPACRSAAGRPDLRHLHTSLVPTEVGRNYPWTARRSRFEAAAKAEWEQTPIATSRLMTELVGTKIGNPTRKSGA